MTIKEIEKVLGKIKRHCEVNYCASCGIAEFCRFQPAEFNKSEIKKTARMIKKIMQEEQDNDT